MKYSTLNTWTCDATIEVGSQTLRCRYPFGHVGDHSAELFWPDGVTTFNLDPDMVFELKPLSTTTIMANITVEKGKP